MGKSRGTFFASAFGRQWAVPVAVFVLTASMNLLPCAVQFARAAVLGNTEISTNETHADGVDENGGGLYSRGTTTISGTATAVFSGNMAFTSGGGLFSTDAFTLKDSATASFVRNSAGVKGGGLYSGGAFSSADDTSFVATGNVANQGGGLYANGVVTLAGHAEFTGNIAKDMGGAIFATGDVILTGSAVFSGNTALTGGAVYTESAVQLNPTAGKSIRFTTDSDSIHAAALSVGGQGTVYFNAPNTITDSVTVTSGTTQLAAANAFSNIPLRVEGGTLHMGGNAPATLSGNVNGAGTATPYASRLKWFHLGDGATLSLGMNVANNANVPYFTLADGYAATTGTGTTVYGVIGSSLTNAADGAWTYRLFSGSSGAEGDFAPTSYRTSNALISLVNPTYANGEFTLDVVRTTPPAPEPIPPTPTPDPKPDPKPDPDPVPPLPPLPPMPDPVPPAPDPTPEPAPGRKPVITGDFMDLFPKNSLAPDMEMVLYYDYLYNGGTIAKPGPGTLIGQNAFLDGLMLVLPNGQAALTPTQRLVALESAASMANLSGALDMLRDTGNRLREEIFAPDAVRNSRAAMSTTSDGSGISLWATPVYGHETGRNRTQYGSLDAGYRSNLYGGMIGLDALFADGKLRAGGVFTVGHGKLDSTGEAMKTSNDVDYVGGALFGAWLPTPAWEIGVYTGYIGQKNDVTQANILPLQSQFDADLWQIGLNAQYAADMGNDGKRKLTVALGVDAQRYTRDGHGITADGTTIANIGKSTLHQVQMPLTMGLQDTFEFADGSSLTVDGRVGYRLTAGDLATTHDWSIPRGAHKARITGPDIDRNTGLAGIGAFWRKEQLAVGVSYDAELGRKRTSHQLSGQIRLEF